MNNGRTKGVIALANNKSSIVEVNFLPGMDDLSKLDTLQKLMTKLEEVKSVVMERLQNAEGAALRLAG